uniref:Peptidase A2 domain-containing protein n=1 Tax=Romanomermis culicivorax TaxID=13658 RepID=A0A915KRW3_ROMCU
MLDCALVIFLDCIVVTQMYENKFPGLDLPMGHMDVNPFNVAVLNLEVSGCNALYEFYMITGKNPKSRDQISEMPCRSRIRNLFIDSNLFMLLILYTLILSFIFVKPIYTFDLRDQNKFQGLYSTNHTLNVNYKWCCADVCKTVENFIIEEGQIASWDGSLVGSDLGDLGGCIASSGQNKNKPKRNSSIEESQQSSFTQALLQLGNLKSKKDNKSLNERHHKWTVKFNKNEETVDLDTPDVNLSFEGPKKTPHTIFRINGNIQTNTLIDTGAVYSLLDADVAEKVHNIQICPSKARPIAANR